MELNRPPLVITFELSDRRRAGLKRAQLELSVIESQLCPCGFLY